MLSYAFRDKTLAFVRIPVPADPYVLEVMAIE